MKPHRKFASLNVVLTTNESIRVRTTLRILARRYAQAKFIMDQTQTSNTPRKTVAEKLKRWSIGGFALLVLVLISWRFFFRPSTPEGVNVEPIMSLKPSSPFQQIDAVKELVAGKVTEQREAGVRILIFSPPYVDTTQSLVFRSINLYQCENQSRALEEYVSYKQLFTDPSTDGRLYREHGSDDDRYFVSYKTTRLNTNHGIPIGVITSPEILIGVLKGNLFVVISYTAFRNDVDYLSAINEDILYVTDLLARSVK